MFTILQTWTKVCSKMSQGTRPRKILVKKDDLGPAVEKQGTVAQTRWRRPATCFIQVCLGNNKPHRPRLQICCRALQLFPAPTVLVTVLETVRVSAWGVARHEQNLLQSWTTCRIAGKLLPPWRRSRE